MGGEGVMQENIIRGRDHSISLIRLIATLMIVSCHMMQYQDFVLTWWFNVGVQIFLCMSGYLYGRKKFDGDDISFYKKQFTKILIDYYIVMIFVIAIQFILVPSELSLVRVIESLLTYKTLEGGGHMWYIPYILLCYFLTPFLIRLFNRLHEKNKSYPLVVGLLAIMLTCFVIAETFIPYFNSAWINCYILGLFLGFCQREGKLFLTKSIIGFVLVATVCMNGVQIYIDYFSNVELSGATKQYYNFLYSYAHLALGVCLFFGMKSLFSKAFSKGYPKIIEGISKYSDKLSYDVYLVHLFFILGPLSLMELTPYLLVNIVLILLLVLLAAMITNRLSVWIRKL